LSVQDACTKLLRAFFCEDFFPKNLQDLVETDKQTVLLKEGLSPLNVASCVLVSGGHVQLSHDQRLEMHSLVRLVLYSAVLPLLPDLEKELVEVAKEATEDAQSLDHLYAPAAKNNIKSANLQSQVGFSNCVI
jgi:hypothetical protein